MVTKKERQARSRTQEGWPDFCDFVQGTLDGRHHGQTLQEADVEQVFERLAGDLLGYGPDQIGRQQDYADRTLHGQGMKLAVVEIKSFGAFERDAELEDALVQAARYADRHRTPNLVAFDGENLVLALRRAPRDDVAVVLWETIDPDAADPPEELFHFNYLLSPGGYRGNTADESEQIDEGDRLLAALKLARAYDEVGKWEVDREGFYSDEKPTPVQLLWRYLYQKGVTADQV